MNLQLFKNERFGEIRVIDKGDNPVFCLPDLCKVLNLESSKVSQRLGDGVLTTHPIADRLGRIQNTSFVNEDGLYDVILESRKPEAKAFRKWVTSEVLPSIRKHGAYLTNEKVEAALMDPDTIIKLATALKAERAQKQEVQQQLAAAQDELRTVTTKALFADAVSASSRAILVANLANILKQNGIDMGQNRLYVWLRDNHYLGCKGDYYNQPTQRSLDLGLFEVKMTQIIKPDGTVLSARTTKVTGKGQVYFVNKFLNPNQHELAS